MLKIEDQDLGDLAKCLININTRPDSASIMVDCSLRADPPLVYLSVLFQGYVALGGLGGRLDHVLQNLSTLFAAPLTQGRPLWLVDGDSLAAGVAPGESRIAVAAGLQGPALGLAPLVAPCAAVTTAGLQWNLGSECFGGA